MIIHKYGFIGHSETNTTRYWDSPQDKDFFEKNLETMPPDWYFRAAEISYKINSLGHRSKEIEDIDLDNYILFTGCSNTEGASMPLEKTYPYLLAEQLNCDYYNLALSATGTDVALHNLIIWFSVIPKKPKAVIIQWPDYTRIITGDANNLEPRGLWYNNDDYNKFVNLGIDLKFFDAKRDLANSLIKSLITVPIVFFGLSKVVPFSERNVEVDMIDKARDLGHPGVKSHQLFADSIYEHLINTECLNFSQNTEPKN